MLVYRWPPDRATVNVTAFYSSRLLPLVFRPCRSKRGVSSQPVFTLNYDAGNENAHWLLLTARNVRVTRNAVTRNCGG